MNSKIEKIAESIWAVRHDLFMPGRVHFNTRMVIVRLDDGRLWIHSPVPVAHLKDDIEALGEVGFLVAPSRYHHVYFAEAAATFPEAQRWGAPGLAEKCGDLAFTHTLPTQGSPWPELEAKFIEGVPEFNETVFFHQASKTLVCTDLIFNIQSVQNWHSRMVFKMTGAWQKPAQSRLWKFMTKDRAAAGSCVAETTRWPIERVVMCHGEVIDGLDAKQQYTQALRWMLSAVSDRDSVAA